MQTIFVHIGGYKTGSTSFQHWLVRHREELAGHGVLVPRAGLANRAHHDLVWRAGDAALWQELRDELDASEWRIAVISSEHLANAGELVRGQLAGVAGARLVPVMVTRRPDQVLLSHWADRVGFGETRSFAAYAVERMRQPDIRARELSRRWEAGILVPYRGSSMVGDLCVAMGIPRPSEPEPRIRPSRRIAGVFAVRAMVRRALLARPALDTGSGRRALAEAAERYCDPADDSPPASEVGVPRDLVEPLLEQVLDPRVMVGSLGWRMSGGDVWVPDDIVSAASQLFADEWERAWGDRGRELAAQTDLEALIAHCELDGSPDLRSGLGRDADQRRLDRALAATREPGRS